MLLKVEISSFKILFFFLNLMNEKLKPFKIFFKSIFQKYFTKVFLKNILKTFKEDFI